MKKFNIYTHELLPTQIVKEGWSWPAFFFNIFWALVKKMWGVFLVSWLLYIFLYVIAQLILNPGDFTEYSMADIVPIAFGIIFGIEGNSWRVKKLNKLGYKYSDTINAQNYKIALNKYKAKAPSSIKGSSPKANLKIASSPGIEFDSDGIPSKKKVDSSSTKVKSPEKKSTTKDIQPKATENPKTFSSDNNSEYVDKLKEAKSLLDDDLINKADFEKIKKKIIDSL